jgi:hypothetical protein
MYKIIGGDGNEYGPVDLKQIQQWIQDGRAGAQTKVQLEGSTDWKALGEVPELAALLGSGASDSAPPTFTPAPASGSGEALQMVQGPAIGLIVTAALGFVAGALGIIMNLAGVTMGAMGGQQQSQEVPAWVNMMSGGLGIVSSLLGIVMSVVILMGALKMKRLENYTFAIIATVVAMVPCISPCCFVGLPIGIWALVVLNKPEVKGAFD